MEGQWDNNEANQQQQQKRQKKPTTKWEPSNDQEKMGHHLLTLFAHTYDMHSVFSMSGRAQGVFTDNKKEPDYKQLSLKALDLDLYYARLVGGAAVSTNMKTIWIPASPDSPDQEDMANVRNTIWNAINTRMEALSEEFITRWKASLKGKSLKNRYQNSEMGASFDMSVGVVLRNIKREIETAWVTKDQYRISDQVHMVEIELLRRLHRDGAFPTFSEIEGNHGLILRSCLIMRRHPDLRYPFASAVGKRLFSAKVVATQRAQIMEHRRSSMWSEQEYALLFTFMRDKGMNIFTNTAAKCQLFGAHNESNNYVLTHDYICMLNWFSQVQQPFDERNPVKSADPAAAAGAAIDDDDDDTGNSNSNVVGKIDWKAFWEDR